MIKGLDAYHAAYGDAYLKVANNQPAKVTSQSTGSTVAQIEDKVSLSATAKALLDQQSKVSPLNKRQIFPHKTNINPLVDRYNTPFNSSGNPIDARFSDKNLRASNLSGQNLNNTNLKGTDFSHSVLRNTSFANADLSGANFTGADLRGANFAGAKGLTSEQLIGARVDSSTVLPLGLLLK